MDAVEKWIRKYVIAFIAEDTGMENPMIGVYKLFF
jgi:hypothetical protein